MLKFGTVPNIPIDPVKVVGLGFNPLCPNYEKAVCLGDQIRMAAMYQTEIGAPVSVQYDSPDTDSVNAMTSPDHDFFDLANMANSNNQPNDPYVPPMSLDVDEQVEE